MADAHTRGPWRRAGEVVSALVITMVLYFAIPLEAIPVADPRLTAVLFVVGLFAVGALVTWRVVQYRRDSADNAGRVRGLVVALSLTIAWFAAAYYVMQNNHGDEFVGLSTRLDALYFSLSVVSTVGFGDVHAIGQSARGLVSLQIVFNVAFLGLALSAIRNASPLVRPLPSEPPDRTGPSEETSP